MSRPTRSFPSPEDAAARYDAVLRRGHSLRRRQRLVTGAGAGGAVLAVLATVVFVTTSGSDTDDNQVVTDPTVTTTTVQTPAGMSVTVTASASSVEVTVDDPAQPKVPEAQICAYVSVAPTGQSGIAAAEVGPVCWTPATDGSAATTADLRLTQGAAVYCPATTAERDPDAPPTSAPTSVPTKRVEHDFDFSIPAGLPPSDYVAEVTAVSGVGDGCPPQLEGEIESPPVTDKDTFTLP